MGFKLLAKPILDSTIPNLANEFNRLNIKPELYITPSNEPADLSYVKGLTRICNKVGIKIVDSFNDNIPCLVLKGTDEIYKVMCKNNNMDNYPHATPKAIINLLNYYGIKIDGSVVTIIGRSKNLGNPLSQLFEDNNATVIKCNSHTSESDLKRLTCNSNIVISACGIKDILRIGYNDIIYIDIGIHVNDNGEISGDFNQNVYDNCKAYTPVPGCIGPLTCIEICKNVLNFYKER